MAVVAVAVGPAIVVTQRGAGTETGVRLPLHAQALQRVEEEDAAFHTQHGLESRCVVFRAHVTRRVAGGQAQRDIRGVAPDAGRDFCLSAPGSQGGVKCQGRDQSFATPIFYSAHVVFL
ncbi:hypothetical protein D9M70_622780 [compost metagenome]